MSKKSENGWACKHCGCKCETCRTLQQHINDAHNNTRCQYCGQGFSTQRGCHRHELTCDKNPHSISKRTTPRYNKTNQRYAIIDGKRKLISGCSWNKGLTKDTDARVKSYTEKHLHNTYWLGKHHLLETRIKLAKKWWLSTWFWPW